MCIFQEAFVVELNITRESSISYNITKIFELMKMSPKVTLSQNISGNYARQIGSFSFRKILCDVHFIQNKAFSLAYVSLQEFASFSNQFQ